jgi:hypothetical protein
VRVPCVCFLRFQHYFCLATYTCTSCMSDEIDHIARRRSELCSSSRCQYVYADENEHIARAIRDGHAY